MQYSSDRKTFRAVRYIAKQQNKHINLEMLSEALSHNNKNYEMYARVTPFGQWTTFCFIHIAFRQGTYLHICGS